MAHYEPSYLGLHFLQIYLFSSLALKESMHGSDSNIHGSARKSHNMRLVQVGSVYLPVQDYWGQKMNSLSKGKSYNYLKQDLKFENYLINLDKNITYLLLNSELVIIGYLSRRVAGKIYL